MKPKWILPCCLKIWQVIENMLGSQDVQQCTLIVSYWK